MNEDMLFLRSRYVFCHMGSGKRIHITTAERRSTYTLCGNGPPQFRNIDEQAEVAPLEQVCKSCLREYKRRGRVTSDDVLEMSAGPELDALVADVFGDSSEWRLGRKVYHRFGLATLGNQELPAPVSTDMGAAWKVVDILTDNLNYSVVVRQDKGFGSVEIFPSVCYVEAASPAEATCKAAVLLMLQKGGEHEQGA